MVNSLTPGTDFAALWRCHGLDFSPELCSTQADMPRSGYGEAQNLALFGLNKRPRARRPSHCSIEHPQELINRLQYGAADAEQVTQPCCCPAGAALQGWLLRLWMC